jgi:RNA polymerase sigma factor (sigma-70 family)
MSPHAGELLVHQVAPRIRSAAPHAVRAVGCEDAEEIIQDAIAIAAKLYDNAEQAGKTVTPGNITYYALQHAKSGRRSYGQSKTCPLHPSTQINGRADLHSFEEPTGEEEWDETYAMADVFSRDEEDPAIQAARKLDWEQFLSTLSERARQVLETIAEGTTMRELAVRLNISEWTILRLKEQTKNRLVEFFGTEILADIVRRPLWRSNLDCNHELLACRAERMAR